MNAKAALKGSARGFRSDRRVRTLVIFGMGCALGLGFLWVKAGGEIPLVVQDGAYEVSFKADDVKHLRPDAEVRVAGVTVGRVESVERVGDHVDVRLSIEDEAAPLHEGANVRIGLKALVGSSFVELVDGDGGEIEHGTTLPKASVPPAVDVDELLDTLDEPTRAHLSAAVQSLDRATRGRGAEIDEAATGLGKVGGPGRTVLEALADQSADLRRLSVEARRLLDALDTGQGQIVGLVQDAQALTQVTADNQKNVKAMVRLLPGVVTGAESAGAKLSELSGPLAPIAADLREASPYLSMALTNLKPVSRDLRGLLPSLDGVLDRAPATLSKVEPFGKTVRTLVPSAEATLADVQPMLSYLAPYGLDIGALFASFGGSFDQVAEDGIRPIRLTADAQGLGTVRNSPVKLVRHDVGGLLWNNPYPLPGTVDQPQPFGKGDYPRVERGD